jgi:hypothetical protein
MRIRVYSGLKVLGEPNLGLLQKKLTQHFRPILRANHEQRILDLIVSDYDFLNFDEGKRFDYKAMHNVFNAYRLPFSTDLESVIKLNLIKVSRLLPESDDYYDYPNLNLKFYFDEVSKSYYMLYETSGSGISDALRAMPEFNDYSYSDHSERPEDIPVEEWDERAEVWKRLFGFSYQMETEDFLSLTILSPEHGFSFSRYNVSFANTSFPTVDERAEKLVSAYLEAQYSHENPELDIGDLGGFVEYSTDEGRRSPLRSAIFPMIDQTVNMAAVKEFFPYTPLP